jgi:hypothetical protein
MCIWKNREGFVIRPVPVETLMVDGDDLQIKHRHFFWICVIIGDFTERVKMYQDWKKLCLIDVEDNLWLWKICEVR